MLELARKIGHENARLKAGAAWQSTLGIDLYGKTLGIIGLGKLGSRVARIGNALDMKVIAWSQNLTAEKAKEKRRDAGDARTSCSSNPTSSLCTCSFRRAPRGWSASANWR